MPKDRNSGCWSRFVVSSKTRPLDTLGIWIWDNDTTQDLKVKKIEKILKKSGKKGKKEIIHF